MTRHEWLLKRNCALTPCQLACAYAVLCFGSFSVAAMFAFRGAWYVFVFAVLEMAAVALAFFQYARHATDHEHIVLADDCLLVERVQARHIHQIKLDPYWTRIALPSRTQDLISLEAKGMKIDVGRFVTEAKRRQVAHELQDGLRNGLFAQANVRECPAGWR